MKLLIALVIVFSSTLAVASQYLAEKVLPTPFVDQGEAVVDFLQEELHREGSSFRAVIVKYAEENDFLISEHSPEQPTLWLPTEPSALVMLGSGRSGAQYAGLTYLVPVRSSFPGSGLIQDTAFFFVVDVNMDIGEGTTTILVSHPKFLQDGTGD